MNKNKKHKISAKKWQTFFPHDDVSKYVTYFEIYYKSPDIIRVDHKINLLGKFVILVIIPIVVLLVLVNHGFSVNKDLKSAFKEAYGCIILNKPYESIDYYSEYNKRWDIISNIIGKYENE